MKKILLLAILIGVSVGGNVYADTVTLQPGPIDGKDSYYGTVYETSDRGDYVEMDIGGWGDYHYSFIEFDVFAIPAGSVVETAVLSLYQFKEQGNSNSAKVMRVTEPWTEAGLSLTSSPLVSDAGVLWKPIPAVSQWWDVDVTNLVDGWVSGVDQNYGMRIEAELHSNNHKRYFYTSDYLTDITLRPQLTITYTPPVITSGFIALSQDTMDAIELHIEYAAVVPVYQSLIDKIVSAYENGHLVRSDRRLLKFKGYITEGLGKVLFTRTERQEILQIIKNMQDILVSEG